MRVSNPVPCVLLSMVIPISICGDVGASAELICDFNSADLVPEGEQSVE